MKFINDRQIINKAIGLNTMDEKVTGLFLIKDVFSPDEEKAILSQIMSDKKAHICHQVHTAHEYGWRFIPIAPKRPDEYLGKLPDWLHSIWETVISHDLFPKHELKSSYDTPDNVLLNTYQIGDGCSSHVDDLHFWNDWVVGVSFGSGCFINFTNYSKITKTVKVWLPPRSVYVLTGDARYMWQHGIDYAKFDVVDEVKIDRNVRYSLTFRTINERYLTNKVKSSIKDPVLVDDI